VIIFEVVARLAGEVIELVGQPVVEANWIGVELNDGHWVLREVTPHDVREKLGAR